MPPDEPSDEEKLEQLPEDGQTPFSPPDPSRDPDLPADAVGQTEETIDDMHPNTDDGIDSDEYYQEGLASAAGGSNPHPENAVAGYDTQATNENVPDEQTDERGVS